MGVIKIRGLEISACHGVFENEKMTAQKFIFDVDMNFDFFAAAKDDNLEYTVNYAEACKIIENITVNNTFNLIETLAYSCAYALLDAFAAKGVKICVYKPQAPMNYKFSNVGAEVEVLRERVYLSLGSSIGDRKKYLDDGISKLSKIKGIKVKQVSSYMRTEPYGGVAENEFLNCAAEIETYLSPQALLNEIHRVEEECGRVRTVKWGDRTLDIDIIFYGDRIIAEDNLLIPHPEYAKREFVILPLKEIAPHLICPDTKKLLKNLQILK